MLDNINLMRLIHYLLIYYFIIYPLICETHLRTPPPPFHPSSRVPSSCEHFKWYWPNSKHD